MHKFEAITEQMTYFPKLIKQQYVGEAVNLTLLPTNSVYCVLPTNSVYSGPNIIETA